MKIYSLIKKNILLQLRDYWTLLITVLLGPFFVFIYWMISVGFPSYYNVIVLNQDRGIEKINYGKSFLELCKSDPRISETIQIKTIDSIEKGKMILKKRDADVMLVLPENFSSNIERAILSSKVKPEIYFYGEKSNTRYLVGVITSYSIIDSFIKSITKATDPWKMIEYFVDEEKVKRSDFEFYIPGILILSIIMLFFSGGMIVIRDIEDQSIFRLKLTKMNVFDYAIALGVTEILVGIISVILTFGFASLLGFRNLGSFFSLIVVCSIVFIGIVGVTFIIVSLCKNATVFVIAGQIPLFVLIFFTGAMIPIPRNPFFYIFNHGVCWNDFLPATLAVTTLNSIFNDGQSLPNLITPLSLLLIVSIFYLTIGLYLFQKKHLELKD